MSGWVGRMHSNADDARQLIEDCIARESRLTEWERQFIDSVSSRLDAGGGLSPKQQQTLDDIWDRATARG